MSKRFTDVKKWRNEWYRTLPLKAKLAWIYLCDECESHGVLKIDYGLASFQLGFDVNRIQFEEWFKDKIYIFDEDKILIIPFFEFQYGTCKDTFEAKIRAKSKLIALGFSFNNNKLIVEKNNTPTTVGGESSETCTTRLISISSSISISKKRGSGGKTNEIKNLYKEFYPLKKGGTKGAEKLSKEISSDEDLLNLKNAILKYSEDLKKKNTDPKFIKHFSTFAGEWRDWLEPDAGMATLDGSNASEDKWANFLKSASDVS